MHKNIVTLVGVTCSGKTTLKDQLLATGEYIEVISHTTRPMREGEVDGVTYHYVTPEEFDQLEFLEVIKYNGNTYGGSTNEFNKAFDSGMIPVVIVEPNGNKQINLAAKKLGWNVINVWVGCPIELQYERFIKRLLEDYGTDKLDIKEYVGRLVMMQTVESNWSKLFVDSVCHTMDGKGVSEVLDIPEFSSKTELCSLERLASIVNMHK